MKASIHKEGWRELEVFVLKVQDYTLKIIPSFGAQVLSFRDKKGSKILREAGNYENFMKNPLVYGIPILFPPNRIMKGQFTFDNREYKLPVNRPDLDALMHGFVFNKAFKILKEEISEDHICMKLVYHHKRGVDAYPHEFVMVVTFDLTNEGLIQTFEVENLSDQTMPVGIGLHTAFDLEDCVMDHRVQVGLGQRWQQENKVPTGQLLKLNDEEETIKAGGLNFTDKQYALHYTNDGGRMHIFKKDSVVTYHVGESFKNWVLWNDDGASDFVCVEPMSWPIDGPNIDLPYETTGVIALEPDRIWREETLLYKENRQ